MIKSRKRRDPTMEERLDLELDDVEETDDQKLQQLFNNLEQEWDFIKKRPEKTLYKNPTGSSKMMITTLGLLENYPRKIMSSLQHRISPPPSEEVAWKVRTNDLAIQEILTERRAAIESGQLKGRRLFEEVEGVTDVGFGRCGGLENGNLVQESEERSVFSYESDDYEDENWERNQVLSPSCPRCCSYSSSSSSSSLCAEKVQIRGGIACDHVRSVRLRGMVIMVWIAIIIVVCMVGIISRRINFGLYEDEVMILTPT